jgi:hypothetical protein
MVFAVKGQGVQEFFLISLHSSFINEELVSSRNVNLLHLIERGENDPFYPYIKIEFEIAATTVTDRNGRFIFEQVKSGEV